VLFSGSGNPDPAAVDDRAWIHSTHTADGVHVVALAHEKYHGKSGSSCNTELSPSACWRSSIIEISSKDGGRTFRRDGVALVASSPYRYDAGTEQAGYFNPSNIIERGAFLYVFIWAAADREQRQGPCLLRRPTAGGAADWRAWDGNDFSVRFADPYREEIANPARHVCVPITGVASEITSVVEAPDGRLIAVTPTTRGDEAGRVPGVYWIESVDFVTWSPPELLLSVPLLQHHGCDEAEAYSYPSLLDPESPSPAYTTTGKRPWLYLVEVPLIDCRAGPERNLLRFPVALPMR
jgi:hypothetical protein